MFLMENPLTRLKKVMNGLEKGVYSFGIITAENPMGEKLSYKDNLIKNNKLKDYLKNGLYQYIFIKGKYGNIENPFVILNINKDEIINMGTIYKQESFIFARNYFDYVEFQYWQQEKNGLGKFKMLDSTDHYTNSTAEDFYSYKKNWMFNIPFSIFEEVQKKQEFTYGDFNEDLRKNINEINKHIVFCKNKTLSHLYNQRGFIKYLEKQQVMHIANGECPSFQESGNSFNAYWVKFGKVYEVTRHIRFILDNPELFDFTKDELIALFKKNGEKIGQEGKAREEIIKAVSQDGWIRVRHYKTPKNYWTIQVDNTKKRKRSISLFIDYAIDKLGMQINDAISILGYWDNISINYSYQDGGVSKYLMDENKKTKK